EVDEAEAGVAALFIEEAGAGGQAEAKRVGAEAKRAGRLGACVHSTNGSQSREGRALLSRNNPLARAVAVDVQNLRLCRPRPSRNTSNPYATLQWNEAENASSNSTELPRHLRHIPPSHGRWHPIPDPNPGLITANGIEIPAANHVD